MNLETVDNGIRPGGESDRCFYCHQPAQPGLTTMHLPTCTLVIRTAVIESTIRWVAKYPQDFDPNLIEFCLNESSSCASNIIDRICEQMEYAEKTNAPCPCGRVVSRFIREATAEDHARCGYFEEKQK